MDQILWLNEFLTNVVFKVDRVVKHVFNMTRLHIMKRGRILSLNCSGDFDS